MLISNYSNLIITNFCICRSCNKRYLENWDEEDSEQLKRDGNTIRKNLKDDKDFIIFVRLFAIK